MRTYGRVTDEFGNKTWVVVETDQNGNNDAVYLTALIQVLKLNLYESPFYSDWGIPAQPCVATDVFPDFYVIQTQKNFSSAFASLSIKSVSGYVDPVTKVPAPYYDVDVVTHTGAKISGSVPQ